MLVTIRGVSKQISVTTVILSNAPEDPAGLQLNMFFCFNCQNPIVQYVGEVVYIMPGRVPGGLPLIHKCSNCKKLYNFQSFA